MSTNRCPVVIDLRTPQLLALAHVGYRGQSLIAATVAGLVRNGNYSVVVLVETETHARTLQAPTLPLTGPSSVPCVTEQQLDSFLSDAHDRRPMFWLTSLVPGLRAEELERAVVEHTDHIRSGWVGSHGLLLAGGEYSPARVAGWMLDTAKLGGVRESARAVGSFDAANARPLARMERAAFVDLEGWSAFVRIEQRLQAERLLRQGARLDDWESLQVTGELQCALGVSIGPHVICEGRVILSEGVTVGPYAYLRDVNVGRNTEIKAFSMLEEVQIAEDCRVGPYARLRGRTILEKGVSIGNFVELKATKVGVGGRINHMTFLGDAELGQDVTIGAGVNTCNHDGERSVATRIEQGAYIGCGTQLVAPLIIGKDATIGAGSTITETVEPGGLTLARSRQVRISHWARRGKK